jgi:glycosyltransferase
MVFFILNILMSDSILFNQNKLILITIITVVYNNVKHIKGAIKSVISQNYPNIEYVVIDGNSNDGTLEVLEEFRNQISVLLVEPDRGIYDALNKGISLSNGEFIGFLHSDDFFANNEVISDIAKVIKNDNSAVVYGDLDYVNNKSIVRRWKSGNFSHRKLDYGWMPPHPTFYARRNLYENYGSFNLNYKIASDYDCMLRFLQKDIVVSYIPKVLIKMRLGGASNRSIRNIIQKSLEDYRIMKDNNMRGFVPLIWKNLSKLQQFFKQ